MTGALLGLQGTSPAAAHPLHRSGCWLWIPLMSSNTFLMDRWSLGHGDGAAWDCGWDQRRGHRLLSLMFVLDEGSCAEIEQNIYGLAEFFSEMFVSCKYWMFLTITGGIEGLQYAIGKSSPEWGKKRSSLAWPRTRAVLGCPWCVPPAVMLFVRHRQHPCHSLFQKEKWNPIAPQMQTAPRTIFPTPPLQISHLLR